VEILNYSCKSWKIRWIRDGNDWVWVKGLPFSSSDGFECITVFLSLSFTTTNWEYLWLSCFPYWVVVRATQGKQYVNSKVLHKCEDLDLLEMRLIFSFFPKYLPATYRIQKFYTYLILREERERERWANVSVEWFHVAMKLRPFQSYFLSIQLVSQSQARCKWLYKALYSESLNLAFSLLLLPTWSAQI
jgi:hypothetical protein